MMSPDSRAQVLWDRIIENGLVDTHFHVGPEVVPRRYDVVTLAEAAREINATIVLKCHTWPTTPLASLARLEMGVRFIGSVVLNRSVGGLNPDAVHAAVSGNHTDLQKEDLSDPPAVIWMPTVHAAAHMKYHDGGTFDARWTGCGGENFEPLSDEAIEPIKVCDDSGEPLPELLQVLDVIAAHGCTLATGHLDADETVMLTRLAVERKIPRIILTHPHYPCTDLTDAQLVELSSMPGVWIEHCMAIHTLENVPLERFASAIKATGSERVVLASDFGQVRSESFPDGNRTLLTRLLPLIEDTISDDEVVAMFTSNGLKALGLA